MQLDHTRIAIRERGILDILDLSLRVSILHAGPILSLSLVTVAPLMLLNDYLIGWVPTSGIEETSVARYLWLMTQLVFIQSPIASILVTLYLGNAMFARDTSFSKMCTDAIRLSPRLIWCQLIMRGVLPACLLVGLMPRQEDLTAADGLLILICAYAMFARAFRPFINEIVLLERNPLRSSQKDAITVRKRSTALHQPSSGELLGRWIVSAFVAMILTVCVLFSLWYLWGVLFFDWTWGPVILHVCVPLAMWLVAIFLWTTRFLNYLDLRIRREGWEVELMVRAAARRLTGEAP